MKNSEIIELTTLQYKECANLRDLFAIVEAKPIRGLFLHKGKEYLPTGSGYFAENGIVGDKNQKAYEVTDIANYKGDLTPLVYPAHFVEVETGLRERSYTGLKINYKNRTLVCLNHVLFSEAKEQAIQGSFF